MALDILKEKGVPLDKQVFTWRELAGPTYSKLDDDAFTRVRVILMNGIEAEALRFGHAGARMNGPLRERLARVRRIEQHQQTLVNWLNPPNQSPLETTIGFEQVAIEVTAALAQQEPHAYLAQAYRFGLLEDLDHMYRFAALLDRVEGKDANNLLQSYTDIRPGRPARVEHRAPEDDVREPYDRGTAAPLTKLNALTLVAAEHQTHDYYMNIGPQFSDPVARLLYAEIASIEEQHVTQYESLIDPSESWLEKWVLHEATEVYAYWSCLEQEDNGFIKGVWERLLDYELGHLHFAMETMRSLERRDPEALLPRELPDPIAFSSQRDFIRETLAAEVSLRARGAQFIDVADEDPRGPSAAYRDQLNRDGSPSDVIAAGYVWMPGTELVARATNGSQHDAATLHDGSLLEAARLAFARDAEAKGKNAMGVFLDLLGERLAFERTGARLYEALLVKLEAASEHAERPTRDELERIRDEEVQHFAVLEEAVEELGGDPTALTPSADITAVAGAGWVQVLADPRCTLNEGLKVILAAELADNDGWLTLADLAARLGHEDLAERFRRALADEEDHLARVRAWVLLSVEAQAGLSSRDALDEANLPVP